MTYKMLTNHENSFNVIKKLSPIMTRNYTIPYFGSIDNHEFNQKCTFFNVFKFHFHLTIRRVHRNLRLRAYRTKYFRLADPVIFYNLRDSLNV